MMHALCITAMAVIYWFLDVMKRIRRESSCFLLPWQYISRCVRIPGA